MPLCVKCKQFLPPALSVKLDNTSHMCIFCKTEKNEVRIDEDVYKKDEVVLEYKKFLVDLKEKDTIRKKFVKGDIKENSEIRK